MRTCTALAIAAANWLVVSSGCSSDIRLGNSGARPGDAGGGRRGATGTGTNLFGGDVGAAPAAGSDGATGAAGASADDSGKPAEAGVPIGYTTRASCGYAEFDPHNCGTCGHDCQGGACQGGACVPLPPGVLASGLIAPVSVAVDSANVYWLSQGLHAVSTQNQAIIGSAALMKCAKTGCNNRPTVLASGSWDDTGARDRLEGIVSDGTNVYWAANNAILSCAVNGCDDQPTRIASPVTGTPPWSISVNATRVFVASADGVFTCPLGGCVDSNDAGSPVDSGGPENLWAGSVTAVAIDSTTAFWNSYGAMLSCAIGGCNGTPRLLTSPSVPFFVGQIAVDQANVYWALGTPTTFAATNMNINPGYSLLFPAGSAAAIVRCAKGGCNGQGVVLANGLAAPMGLATDGASVYFTDVGSDSTGRNDVGRVAKTPVTASGGTGATIADHLQNPRGIAVDASNVYWADFGSGVLDAASLTPLSVDGRIMTSPK
jgi:hypothetical protein